MADNKIVQKKEDFRLYAEKNGCYISSDFVLRAEEDINKEIPLKCSINLENRRLSTNTSFTLSLNREEIKVFAELLTDIAKML